MGTLTVLRKAFAYGFREGCRPLQRVMPGLARSVGMSLMMVVAGIGVIAVGKGTAEPFQTASMSPGEGLLVVGAIYGTVALLRACLELIRAAAVPSKHR
jgi:hypothetical protein